jgi:hypothetical protein
MRALPPRWFVSSFLSAIFVLAAAHASPASAEVYRPWCAQYYGVNGGGKNCGFVSYEQCMMTARGAGAWCVQNPWYLAYGAGARNRALPR